MEAIPFLALAFVFLVAANLSLMAYLWRRTRSATYRNLMVVWALALVSFAVNLFAAPHSQLIRALAIVGTFPYTSILAYVLGKSLDRKLPWRLSLGILGVAIPATVALGLAGAHPYLVAFPVSFAVGFPSIEMGWKALRYHGSQMTTARKGFAWVVLIAGIHMVDYAIGYAHPEIVPWGFTFGLLIVNAISLFGPAAVLEEQIQENARLEAEVAFKGKLFNAAKISALGEMAGGVAHEINTPLATICLLAERSQEPAILSAANRISRIVKGLLKFAQADDHEAYRRVRLGELLDDTLLLCSERARSNAIELRPPRANSQLELECRPTQVSHLLMNLLNNAFDAASAGANEKWIEISVADLGDRAAIAVTDSGPGIPENLREKLFQPFFTTKDIGKGTGLGLSVSKGIAADHSGDLVLDEDCRNTRFVATFPKRNR